MDALTIQTTPGMPAADLEQSLFEDFVKWIDRSENTTRAYIINLRQFMVWMLYTGTRRPIREDILSYREWLSAEHDAIQLDPVGGWSYRTDSAGTPLRITCKPSTVAQYLRSVCQFFRWTAANGIYPDIAANIHAPKADHRTHKKDCLSPEDVRKIEASIERGARAREEAAATAAKDAAGRMQRSTEQGKRMYAMYLLAVTAGLRTIELSRANVRDLETKGGQSWLYIWGKGHAEPDQKKAIAPEVAAVIRDYLQSRSDRWNAASPLFVSTGNRSGGKRIATTTISTMLKTAMREAGYDSERLTAHSLRHTAGTAVQELTGDLYQTQKYMRHQNPATTEIYLHNETEKADADIAARLYRMYHGNPEKGTAKQGTLETLLDSMTKEQREQLTAIATAIAGKQ